MPYYPKNRIKENQIANPGQFTLPDGTSYSGLYYVTFDGKVFTGANPNDVNSKPLTPNNNLSSQNTNSVNPDVNLFTQIKPLNLKLQDPVPFTPVPTQQDYLRGNIIRYLARQRNGTQFRIMEINEETYNQLNNPQSDLNISLWKTIRIFWQISGPERTQIVDGIRVRAGIIDTNQRILDQAEKNFIGIKQYLTNLKQFAK